VDEALAEVDVDSSPRPRPSLLVVGDAEPDDTIEPLPILAVGDNRLGQSAPPELGMFRCPECGHRADPLSNYCGLCGSRMHVPASDPDVLRCEDCNAEILMGTRFCVQCGGRHRWGD
jgi:DNA-directed RNA polymerase subunit RPC12/RpoP